MYKISKEKEEEAPMINFCTHVDYKSIWLYPEKFENV